MEERLQIQQNVLMHAFMVKFLFVYLLIEYFYLFIFYAYYYIFQLNLKGCNNKPKDDGDD